MKVTYGAIVQRASGRFGGTVHSNWKGVDVVRRFAKPTNPNTTAQQQVRNVFRNLTIMYGLMPAGIKAAWVSYAVGKPLIARNKLIALNVPQLTGELNFANFVATPGDSSTIPPANFNPTGGVNQITTTITAPTIPTGWSITRAWAIAVPDGADPDGSDESVANLTISEASDATDPYAPTITIADPDDYLTFAFLEWLAPDGSTRYSSAVSGGLVTVT